MIENIRVSKKASNQLITLKKRTRIPNWNTLCRWAFCVSLSEKSLPRDEEIPADSSIEMTWKTFGGEFEGVYWSLLLERCKNDGLQLDEKTLAKQFRLHLHRGIGYLVGNKKMYNISDFLQIGLENKSLSEDSSQDMQLELT